MQAHMLGWVRLGARPSATCRGTSPHAVKPFRLAATPSLVGRQIYILDTTGLHRTSTRRRARVVAPLAGASAAQTDAQRAGRRSPLDNEYIWQLVWQQRRQIITALAALIFCVGSNLASPVLSGVLFETLVQGQPFSKYSQLLGMMVVLYVAEPLMSKVYIQAACEAGEKVQAALRLEAFRTLLMQRIEFFDRHRSAELTTLLSKDLDAVRTFVFSNVTRDRGLRAVLEATGSVLVLFWLSWRLGPILAGVILTSTLAAQVYRRQTRVVESGNAAAQSAMAGVASQTFSNIRTVRLFAGEALERERYGGYVAQSFASGINFSKAKALLECINRASVHLSMIALYALGGWLISSGLMPIRTLLSAIGFTYSMVFATQGSLQTFTDLRAMLASLKRVQSVLGEVPPDPSMTAALPPGAWWEVANAALDEDRASPGAATAAAQQPKAAAARAGENGTAAAALQEQGSSSALGRAVMAARRGDLELRGVDFAYPARPNVLVLKGLSLTLPRGKVTAVVGRSGAGKTTVASLLERLYNVDGGGIYLDGENIWDFTRAEWVAALTAVSQEPVLFAGTIAENIGYGKAMKCSQEDIERAAKAANAHGFIMDLPDGYNTIVGERGSLLSGGQRQRIALARALLKDSPILILDEATSALDTESEQLVQQAIDKLVEGRTVLVIAHRLSTVQSADQIVVLENGRIEEMGTHLELVEHGGLYASLVSSQSLALSKSV